MCSSDLYKARILDATGPLSLIQKGASDADNLLAAQLIVTYGKTNMDQKYSVKFYDENDEGIVIEATKLPSKEVAAQYLIQ